MRDLIDQQMKSSLSPNTTALRDNPPLSPTDSITHTVPMPLNTRIVARGMTRHHSETDLIDIAPFEILEVLATGTMMAMKTLGVAGPRGNLMRASLLVMYVIVALQPFYDDTTAGIILSWPRLHPN
jgi:hypothetical protein